VAAHGRGDTAAERLPKDGARTRNGKGKDGTIVRADAVALDQAGVVIAEGIRSILSITGNEAGTVVVESIGRVAYPTATTAPRFAEARQAGQKRDTK